MTFYIEFEDSYMAFTGDFICCSDNSCQNAGLFKLKAYLPDSSSNIGIYNKRKQYGTCLSDNIKNRINF